MPTFTGDNGPNVLEGGGGDDLLLGLGGNDSLDGGAGNDSIEAGDGNDTVVGSEGRDTVLGGAGNDRFVGIETEVNGLRTDARQAFEGGAGNDTIEAHFTFGVTTFAEYRNDPNGVIVNLSQESIVANIGAGNVTVTTGTARDGYGGTDTLHENPQFGPFVHVDGVVGSSHADWIQGGAFAPGVGGSTNQVFEGLAGDDTIIGGFDFGGAWVSYESSTSGVFVNLSSEDVEGGPAAHRAFDGYGDTDRLSQIDRAMGSMHDDTFVGGFDDEEHFEGLGGDDSIDGGGDIDNVYYRGAGEGVVVDLGAGTAGALDGVDDDGTIGSDTLAGIEAAHGSDFADSLLGGGAGAQPDPDETLDDFEQWEIDLYLGFEEFAGLAGDDTLNGGEDPAGDPIDIALYRESPGAVFVNLSANDIDIGGDTVLAGTARDGYGVNANPEGTDVLIDINGAEGSRFDDTLIGGDEDNYFDGRQGNDYIDGGGGNDFVSYESASSVYVNLLTGEVNEFNFSPDIDVDTLVDIENIIGTEGDDHLVGDGNDNLLDGNEGLDFIVQTRGLDTLDGGDGVDDVLMFQGNGITYSSGGPRVYVNLGEGVSNADYDPDTDAGEDVAQVMNIEYVDGTAGEDVLIGGGTTRMSIGMLMETFNGHEGDDTIDGLGTGKGGVGFIDRVDYSHLGNSISVDLGGGIAFVGDDGTDTLSNINWVTASFFGDVLNGGDAPLEGFEGMSGSDVINGGAGFDVADYSASMGAVNVNLATGVASDGWGFTDALSGIEAVFGSFFSDRLTGSAASGEYFIGGAGNDTINGGAGFDIASYRTNPLEFGGVMMSLGSGSEILVNDGMGGSDRLIGIEGLEGTNSDDTLAGGDGNHVFLGLGGDDSLSGGAGRDTADYSQDPNGVIVNLGPTAVEVELDPEIGIESVGANRARDGWGGDFELGGEDTLGTIENVVGSQFNDHITGSDGTGSALANLLDGNLGNDTLNGGGGNDTLLGGEGDDVLDGGTGNDTLDGGAGNDTVRGGAGDDTFVDASGDDVLEGGDGKDLFFVGYGNGETVAATGDGGLGGAFVDTYVLSPDSVGDYTFLVTDFQAGAGGDVVDVQALLVASTVDGFYDGTDPIAGGFLRTIQSGDDVLVQWDRDGAVGPELFVTGLTLLERNEGDFVSSNFLGLKVGGELKDKLGGTANNDILLGLGGNDKLSGGGGDDLLFGGTGVDTMSGGSGDDTYHVDSLKDRITGEVGGSGALILPGGSSAGQAGAGDIGDTVIAAIDYTLDHIDRRSIENLRLGGGATKGTGNALANRLTGNAGNDRLVGLGGNDTLDGGTGTDTMDGGTGNDLFFVDDENDVVKETATGGTKDTVHASVSAKLAGNVENLVLLGTDNLNGTGNALNNLITGNSGHNTLIGDKGNDTLEGGGGDDSLVGGAGNDVYLYDGMGDDTMTEAADGGTDTVRSSSSLTLRDHIENLVLTGNQAIDGTGNDLNNRITGNGNDNVLSGGEGAGKDTLEGGSGNDTMDGTAGADSMIGGDGNDHYFVDSTGDKVVETKTGGNHDTVHSSITIGTLADFVETLILEENGDINGGGNGLGNVIIGNVGINVLDGKGGDDFLDGGEGADELIGGAGTDFLVWDQDDTRIDGGTGFDILQVNGGEMLIDLINNDYDITSIQKIDLTGDGNNTLRIGSAEVLAMSGTEDSATNQTLQVDGDTGDTLALAVDEFGDWQTNEVQLGEVTYNTYSMNVSGVFVTLLVHPDVVVGTYPA